MIAMGIVRTFFQGVRAILDPGKALDFYLGCNAWRIAAKCAF